MRIRTPPLYCITEGLFCTPPYLYLYYRNNPTSNLSPWPAQTNQPFIFFSGGGGLAARPRLHLYPFPSGAHSGPFIRLFPARGAVLLGRVRFCRSASCPPVPFESFMGGRGGRPPPPTLPLPAGVSPPGPLIVYRLLGGMLAHLSRPKVLSNIHPHSTPTRRR